jgi:hypothetical protein
MEFWQTLRATSTLGIDLPTAVTGLLGWTTVHGNAVYLVDLNYSDGSKSLEIRILNPNIVYPMIDACSWPDIPKNADQIFHHSIVDGDLSHDQEIGITIRRLRVRLKPGDDHVEVNLSDSSIAAAKQKLGAFQIYRAPPRDWMDYYR